MNTKNLKLTVEALEKIKEVCISFEDDVWSCSKCFFQTEDGCLFKNLSNGTLYKLPHKWKIGTEVIIKLS